jgi:dTDP-4-amino-4,6-dideoxygalactose transaminase
VLVSDRDAFQRHLAANGVGTLVHYPIALHRQQAFEHANSPACPIAERVAAEVCSLPLHPQLRDDEVDAIATVIGSRE